RRPPRPRHRPRPHHRRRRRAGGARPGRSATAGRRRAARPCPRLVAPGPGRPRSPPPARRREDPPGSAPPPPGGAARAAPRPPGAARRRRRRAPAAASGRRPPAPPACARRPGGAPPHRRAPPPRTRPASRRRCYASPVPGPSHRSGTVGGVPGINDIADRYVDELAALHPIVATYLGIGGYDHLLPDYSLDGYAARADHTRRTRAELAVTEPGSEPERVAKEAMLERLDLHLALYEAGQETSQLSVIASGLHEVRGIFDLMPTDSVPAAENVAARLRAVPEALRQIRATLLAEARRGRVAARHQIGEVAKQCDTWTDPAADDFWPGLARRVSAASGAPDELVAELEAAAAAAREATADFARFLRQE